MLLGDFAYASNSNRCADVSEFVYHGSKDQTLKILKSSTSTHGKKWVYATPDLAVAASFLVRAGDFHFGIGLDDNSVFSITERYKDSFALFKGAKGSIYKLSSDGFLINQTGWNLEVVNPDNVVVLEELPVIDAFDLLQKLESEGRLKLYYYPERPSWIPANDKDLVVKAVLWNEEKQLLKLHPHLKELLQEVQSQELAP